MSLSKKIVSPKVTRFRHILGPIIADEDGPYEHADLAQLERDVPPVTDHLRDDLYQLLP